MESAIFIAALLAATLADQLAFPGEENEETGDTPTRLQNTRIPLLVHGACPENQLLYPGDQEHDWICDCGPGFIYYPATDKCYKVYRQGPCKDHQILILPRSKIIPDCIDNLCKRDGFVMYQNKCYKLGESGPPCRPANEGGGVFGVNTTSLELQCLTDTDRLSLINFPPNCPKGGRSPSRCRQEY